MVSATAMHSIALFSYAFADSDAIAPSPVAKHSTSSERALPRMVPLCFKNSKRLNLRKRAARISNGRPFQFDAWRSCAGSGELTPEVIGGKGIARAQFLGITRPHSTG